jgi:hypothetical protein
MRKPKAIIGNSGLIGYLECPCTTHLALKEILLLDFENVIFPVPNNLLPKIFHH